MDPVRVRNAFDRQVRRSTQPDGSGARVEIVGNVVRWVAKDRRGWSGITWSDLDDTTADAAIAGQVGYFHDLGQTFEWKLYDYDRPPDLGGRLVAAGLVPDEEEAVMVAEVSGLLTDVSLPAGVRLVPVTDEAGVGLLIEVHERVFGTDHSPLRRTLLSQLRRAPEMTAMVVAMAGDQPVCSARIEFLPGREFASLWGGGTLAGWRGQGIYRALVAYRAQLAGARGYRYLQVDASPQSRPILERLGFIALARTTPYLWQPPGAGEPDAREPDAGEPDAREPDAGEPDAGEPDAGEPDAGEPDAREPDAGEPDAREPDAREPDAGEPDAGEPDVRRAGDARA